MVTDRMAEDSAPQLVDSAPLEEADSAPQLEVDLEDLAQLAAEASVALEAEVVLVPLQEVVGSAPLVEVLEAADSALDLAAEVIAEVGIYKDIG